MFSLLTKEGCLALRLPSEVRVAFFKKYKTRLCEQYGTVMKEYVLAPDALLRKTAEPGKFFDLSYTYVGSLNPKATSRRTTTKKVEPRCSFLVRIICRFELET